MNKRSVVTTVALLAIVIPAGASAQAGRDRVREGNRLYAEGRFAEAHQKYLEAMAEAPDSPVIPFNDGNALYQDADYQRALEAYQRAIETGDPALASAAWYNLGNVLYRQQQLEQSLEAYKQALRLDPSDADAKHNLERVLDQMQQDQEQEQDDGDQESNDDQEQDGEQQQDQQDQDQNQDQDQPDDQQDEEGPQDQQEPDEAEQPPPEEREVAAQRPPGEMTPEEAERLLDAIDEDPGDVNRKPVSTRGRRPRRPW